MKITLDIKDNRYSSFLELINDLDYVTVGEESEIPMWQQLETIRRSEAAKNGDLEMVPWEEARKNLFKK